VHAVEVADRDRAAAQLAGKIVDMAEELHDCLTSDYAVAVETGLGNYETRRRSRSIAADIAHRDANSDCVQTRRWRAGYAIFAERIGGLAP
jgi:hypothetical protein